MERELVIGRIIKEFFERRGNMVERDLQIPVAAGLKKAITIMALFRKCLVFRKSEKCLKSPLNFQLLFMR